MSINKWNELAKSKTAVSQQSATILDAFKMQKIKDELDSSSYAKLLKPVTKKLGELPTRDDLYGADDLEMKDYFGMKDEDLEMKDEEGSDFGMKDLFEDEEGSDARMKDLKVTELLRDGYDIQDAFDLVWGDESSQPSPSTSQPSPSISTISISISTNSIYISMENTNSTRTGGNRKEKENTRQRE